MEQPLSGMRVLEVGGTIAVAAATKQFSDFGAEVIKIEPPAGGELRRTPPFADDRPHLDTGAYHLALDTGKRSLVLDVETPSGREVLGRLCSGAQLLFLQLPPEAAGRVLGVADSESGPSTVAISPHGLDGPYAGRVENDMSMFAWTTRMYRHAVEADGEPLRYAPNVATMQVGATAAAVGFGAAWGQAHDGTRRHVDVSGVEALAGNVDTGYVDWVLLGTERRARGRMTENYPIGNYACRDGYVMFAATLGPQFQRLCTAIGHPELVDDPRFNEPIAKSQHWADFMEYLGPWLDARTRSEVFHEMQAHRVMVAPVLDMSEVTEDPQAKARGSFVTVEQPLVGPVTIHGAPFQMEEAWVARPSPRLGEHGTEILDALGYGRDEQIALFRAGVTG